MSRSVILTLAKLSITYLAIQSVVGYENAYDLLERRNQRFYEPRYFPSGMFRNRFFAHNRNPYLRYSTVNPYFSKFGNGYDNLGQGILFEQFHPFRQQLVETWRFDKRPYGERTFSNFDFEGYPTLRKYQHDYVNHHSGGYYPGAHVNIPASNEFYGNEFGSRGNLDFKKVERFFEDNEGKNQKKKDEYYQRTQEGVNVDSLKKEKAGEQLRADQIGENKSSLRSNKIVKTGRTTKGFAVHHHKDETGNSTTFFDETSDFGGQSDLRDIADGFGTRKTLEQITHKGDEKYFTENEGQNGNYGSGLLIGNQVFEKDFSSKGSREESTEKFHARNKNGDLGLRKPFQHLNGDRIEFTQPQVDNYY